jgi:DNA segregation ATPase FtsK/SpoIIIE, S-DNA-T family
MGLLIWVVTQSLLSLLFAGLGPLIAVGSLVDGRVQSRRTARREAARFDRELAAAREELHAAHDAERRMLAREAPAAAELVVRDPATRWPAPSLVRLGRGEAASAVTLVGTSPVSRASSREHAFLATFRAEASVLLGAPVTIDASGGIGIVGLSVAGHALYRAVLVQLAAALAPDEWSLAVGPGAEAWLSELPHRARAAPETGVSFVRGDGTSIRVAIVAHRADVPADCRIAVIDDGEDIVFGDGQRHTRLDIPDRVSAAQALVWALRAAAEARERGLGRRSVDTPDRVRFDALDHSGGGAAIGHDGAHDVRIDLLADGPHAVIGGTTGSGKSEFLITWVLALATQNSPDDLTFLLVDFKGGATFGAIADLPHCVGLVTDLDAATADRAFESLAAEIRFRETSLSARGARDISEMTGLPRLVIVVDEFAALATASPHLHTLFGDLAARGRSLGIHLILCTQRPAGIVRDAVLANVGLRISLRVHDRADSLAVIGTPDAAVLAAHPRGRAYLASGGAPPQLLQLALAAPTDIVAVVERWRSAARPRRPWCEPLPTTLPLAALPTVPGGIALGLADHPHEQSQPFVRWVPAIDGSLLVVGTARTGKSTALETIASRSPCVEAACGDPLATWDVVTRALDDTRSGEAPSRVVILDDLDVSLDRLGPEHAAALLERLQSLVREGAAAGIHCAIAVQRVTGALQPVLALCGARMLLRLADRQEHVFAGGVGTEFDESAPPGRAIWRGRALQVATGGAPVVSTSPENAVLRGPFIAVAANPDAFIVRARSAGLHAERLDAGALSVSTGEPRSLVGDPDEWQSHWGALPRFRQTLPLVVDGCSLADYRAVTRQRELPPPLSGRGGQFWLLAPDGSPRRATLPNDHPSMGANPSDSAQK